MRTVVKVGQQFTSRISLRSVFVYCFMIQLSTIKHLYHIPHYCITLNGIVAKLPLCYNHVDCLFVKNKVTVSFAACLTHCRPAGGYKSSNSFTF